MNVPRLANLALRLLIGAIFIWSAALKTFHPASDTEPRTIYTRWVRTGSRTDVAIAVAELFLGLWIILGRFSRVAATFCAAVLLFYTALLVLEIRRNAPLPCGCFWVSPGEASPQEIRQQLAMGIARNVLLIFACAWVFFTASSRTRSTR